MRARRTKLHRPDERRGDKKTPRRSRARSIARGAIVSVAVGQIACTPAAATPPRAADPAKTAAPIASAPPVASATATIEAPPAPVDPSDKLAAYKVTDKDYARRTLYTWTTDGQIGELLQEHVVLSRTESPLHGKSFYDRTIEERWMAGDKLAALLRAPAFARARFAWPAPWATLLGWPGETYGTQLIQVRLKAEAYVVLLRTSSPEWEARDMNGALVKIEDVMKRPDRIAAIHFVHDNVMVPGASPLVGRPDGSDGRQAYREYVLCNESMIESWAVGTEEIAKEIREGADVAEAAAKYFAARPPPAQRTDRWNAHVAMLVWTELAETSGAKEAYEAALAFPNANYAFDLDKLRDLATQMRTAAQHGTSTLFKSNAVFPGAKPVPVPPPPKQPPQPQRRRYGTFF